MFIGEGGSVGRSVVSHKSHKPHPFLLRLRGVACETDLVRPLFYVVCIAFFLGIVFYSFSVEGILSQNCNCKCPTSINFGFLSSDSGSVYMLYNECNDQEVSRSGYRKQTINS